MTEELSFWQRLLLSSTVLFCVWLVVRSLRRAIRRRRDEKDRRNMIEYLERNQL